MIQEDLKLLFEKDESGLILGPDEALCASIEWLIESLRIAPPSLRKYAPKINMRSNTRIRRQLIQLYLLFGRLDARSGRHMLDTYLRPRTDYPFSREIIQDCTNSFRWERTPFSHSFDRAGTGARSVAKIQLDSVEPIVNAIARSLKRAGFDEIEVRKEKKSPVRRRDDFTLNEIEELIKEEQDAIEGRLVGTMASSLGRCVWSTYAALERSLDYGVPFWSRDATAPCWIPKEIISNKVHILKAILDKVEWFPNPQTFSEAMKISDDDRMDDLRNALDLWIHKLCTGEYKDLSDVKKEIRNISKKFNNKPWASKVGRFVTYLAVPATAADALLTGGVIGASLSAVGVSAQCIGDRIEKSKQKSWVSLGNDAYFTKPGST